MNNIIDFYKQQNFNINEGYSQQIEKQIECIGTEDYFPGRGQSWGGYISDQQ